ncbi:MAG: shikimate dehydrogenase [Hydromonas sp.]|nr:shikimate dehydrogenase [Hydromonas sp.]
MSTDLKFYAVIGNPIAHSKSPEIHAQFAAQCGIPLRYERVLAPVDGFAAAVDGLRAQGLCGCNVTVPFKLDAFAYATERSSDVLWAGAANTLSFKNECVTADNTDGVGLVRDITHNLGVALQGKKVLLLGAGGAARGVLRPILNERPAGVVVKNRSLDKAHTWLAQIVKNTDFAQVTQGIVLSVQAWADETLESYDVVINATASGLSDEFTSPSGVRLSKNALAYDMMYGKQTGFMIWAQAQGAQVADGWGMLVEQAAASFQIWHGIAPDTAPLLQRGA